MKMLVTGAAGFIGSHLCEALLRYGHRVVAFDSFTGHYSRQLKERHLVAALRDPRFELHRCSVDAGVDWPRFLEGVSVVFHLAGQPGVRDSWGTGFRRHLFENIEATQVLLEACKTASIERFVYASSSSVYGNREGMLHEYDRPEPFSPYGVTKLAAEQLCRLYHANFGVPTVGLRDFTVYGPRQRPDMAFHRILAAAIRDERIRIFGDGLQRRDFTYVADAVFATWAAGVEKRGRPGEVYNIGGGSTVTLLEVLDHVRTITGEPLRVQHEAAQPGDVRSTCADTTTAREDLGFCPRTTLLEGLRAQYAWVRDTERVPA